MAGLVTENDAGVVHQRWERLAPRGALYVQVFLSAAIGAAWWQDSFLAYSVA